MRHIALTRTLLRWAIVLAVGTFATSGAARQVDARRQVPVAWMLLVDDLHLDFRNTGRIRDLLRRLGAELVHDGDSWGMRTSGPSRVAIDLTPDRSRVAAAIRFVAGNGLKPRDAREVIDEQPNEVLYRAEIALDAARESMARLVSHRADDGAIPRKAFVYLSNGYYLVEPTRQVQRGTGPVPFGHASAAELRARLDRLAADAARAGLKIFVIDPRNIIGTADLDPLPDREFLERWMTATQGSLRPLWESSGGMALLTARDFADGLQRIRAAVDR